MDEIQLFKLMMEREEEMKESKDISVPVLLDNEARLKHWYGLCHSN